MKDHNDSYEIYNEFDFFVVKTILCVYDIHWIVFFFIIIKNDFAIIFLGTYIELQIYTYLYTINNTYVNMCVLLNVNVCSNK